MDCRVVVPAGGWKVLPSLTAPKIRSIHSPARRPRHCRCGAANIRSVTIHPLVVVRVYVRTYQRNNNDDTCRTPQVKKDECQCHELVLSACTSVLSHGLRRILCCAQLRPSPPNIQMKLIIPSLRCNCLQGHACYSIPILEADTKFSRSTQNRSPSWVSPFSARTSRRRRCEAPWNGLGGPVRGSLRHQMRYSTTRHLRMVSFGLPSNTGKLGLPSLRYWGFEKCPGLATANLIFSKLLPLRPVLFSRRFLVSANSSPCRSLVSPHI